MGNNVSEFAANAYRRCGVHAIAMAVEALPSLKKRYDGIICVHILGPLERLYDVLQIFRAMLLSRRKLVISLLLPFTRSRTRRQHLYCWKRIDHEYLGKSGIQNTEMRDIGSSSEDIYQSSAVSGRLSV